MAEYNAAATSYFLGDVESFRFTAGSDLSACAIVTAGRLVGMTRQKFKSGEVGVAFISGIASHYNMELASAAVSAITQGTEVYLNSDGKVTATADSNTRIGCLYQTVAVGDTFADVLLYPPMPIDDSGFTTAEVNALIDAKITTAEVNALIDAKIAAHAALTAGTASGNVHPGASE